MRNENDPHDIVASSTFRDIDIDMDRVKDCAEHFGKCSMKELKQLKGGKRQATSMLPISSYSLDLIQSLPFPSS